MAAQYQVNIQISQGMDFYQEFFLTEADLSPLNITNSTFYASLKKHPSAVNVLNESGVPEEVAVQFETGVVDGVAGVYYIRLQNNQGTDLREGKYVYSVVMVNQSNEFEEVTSGLAFVDQAFGLIKNQTTDK